MACHKRHVQVIEELQQDLKVMTDLAMLRLRGAIRDKHIMKKLVALVREFAAHPCVDCDGCSTEAERRLNERLAD